MSENQKNLLKMAPNIRYIGENNNNEYFNNNNENNKNKKENRNQRNLALQFRENYEDTSLSNASSTPRTPNTPGSNSNSNSNSNSSSTPRTPNTSRSNSNSFGTPRASNTSGSNLFSTPRTSSQNQQFLFPQNNKPPKSITDAFFRLPPHNLSSKNRTLLHNLQLYCKSHPESQTCLNEIGVPVNFYKLAKEQNIKRARNLHSGKKLTPSQLSPQLPSANTPTIVQRPLSFANRLGDPLVSARHFSPLVIPESVTKNNNKKK